ncbi:MAG: hypothetical protein ACM3RX_04435 [Methanococcaceae archaeon]
MVELKGHLLRWDEVKWEEVTDIDKKRIIEFIIHNYDPKLSLTAKIEKTDAKTVKITDGKSTVFLMLEADKGKMNVKIAEKTDELIVKKDIDKKDSKEFIVYPTNSAQGPGDRFVGPTGIVLTLTYLILFSVIIIYSLVQFWPHQAFTDESANYVIVVSNDGSARAQAFTDEKANSSHPPVNSPVTFFRWEFPLSDEERLFLIVALAGALGSSVHALRSFYWYVGNRELVLSWLAMYLLLPFTGALLGLIFYITIRGGLFPQATIQQTSPFAFVAISALVGLFSVQAALKLQDIAETVFTKPGEGRESRRQVSEEDKHEKN